MKVSGEPAGLRVQPSEIFDSVADVYDRWYDSPEGQAIFRAETICLKRLCGGFPGRWLEVGVGTGRFASHLGIIEGLDPSLSMLEIATKRGIKTSAGLAESLPFPDGAFNGVLMVMSLCFIAAPDRALRECRRILQPAGRLLLGIVPAESPWGESYRKKKAMGHPVYSSAQFRSSQETIALTASAGFSLQKTMCTLFWPPDGQAETNPRVEEGISPNAGFLSLLFTASRR
jgi:ubiquinone/menaquinone biosynthesis C-methylase UbiE